MMRGKKRGITLIETMVAIAIFAIGIQGFTMLFMKSWKSNSYILELGQASSAASNGLDRMVKYIRMARQGDDGGYAIRLADKNDLVVYSNYNKEGVTERLHFYLEAGQLKMGITEPTGNIVKTYPGGDQQTLVIADNLVNDDSVPVFSYFNKYYPGDTANNPVATPANVANIRLVKIFLKIDVNSNQTTDALEMQSFVELRNLNDYNLIR